MRNFFRRLRRRALRLYVKVRRSAGTPHEIAGGLAVGIFIGCLPYPGHIVTAIALAWLLRVRKIPAIIGTLLVPPPLWGPLVISYRWLGRWIGRILPASWLTIDHFEPPEPPYGPVDRASILLVKHFAGIVQFLLGAALIAGAIALTVYFIFKPVLERYQALRAANKKRAHEAG